MTTLSIQSTSKGHALILEGLVLCVVADPEAAPLDPGTLYPKPEGTPFHVHKGNVPRPFRPGDKVVLIEDLDDMLKSGTQGVVSAVRGDGVCVLFRVGRLRSDVFMDALTARELLKHAPTEED